MNLNATATFDRAKGTMTVDFALIGTTEMDHELLAAFFTSRTVGIVPAHQGEKLAARFVISDPAAFTAAIHALENRKRKADGRPTIEEEAADAKAAAATRAAGETAAKGREAKNQAELAAAKARIEERAAQIIAARSDPRKTAPASELPHETKPTSLTAEAVKVVEAKEPDKVQ